MKSQRRRRRIWWRRAFIYKWNLHKKTKTVRFSWLPENQVTVARCHSGNQTLTPNTFKLHYFKSLLSEYVPGLRGLFFNLIYIPIILVNTFVQPTVRNVCELFLVWEIYCSCVIQIDFNVFQNDFFLKQILEQYFIIKKKIQTENINEKNN